MKNISTIIAILTGLSVSAQNDSVKSSFTLNAYAEIYYSLSRPLKNNHPGFIYSHNRNNEFNLNIGIIKAAYSSENARANLALAAGTYMSANYAAEPGVLKNIYEANAGVKLIKQGNLWLDAGIFTSHIGFESAISKDCPTLNRSILAENSPYFEAGTKLTYTSNNEQWLISALALNGWQRISRVDGNSMMSWGTQIQYKPSNKILLNYSTFIGTDKPDSVRLLRIYHDVYGIFDLSSKLKLMLVCDFGNEEKAAKKGTNMWYSVVGILRHNINDKFAVAARGEYFQDKKSVLISTGLDGGFNTSGYSINLDYAALANVLVRVEGKYLQSKTAIFADGENNKKGYPLITFSIASSF